MPENYKHQNIGSQVTECFQYTIRRKHEEAEPRPAARMDGCVVREISSAEARPVIEKYEWLGTMGRPQFCVGMFDPDGHILGVACFGLPGSPESRNICGKEHVHKAICLERGACVHWAPPNAASFLIARACEIAASKGFNIIYAYADEDAGEIGNVYQACNWIYIGQGVGRTPGRKRTYYRLPDGSVLSSRALRHRKLRHSEVVAMGWTPVQQSAKHKYVHFAGDRRVTKALRRLLRYEALPYPKRKTPHTDPTSGAGATSAQVTGAKEMAGQ